MVAGVVVGTAAAVGLATSGALDGGAGSADTRSTIAEQRARDADLFTAAWRRSRLATYAVTSTFRRTLAGGGGFTGEVTTAQRPPDRLERQFGSVSGRFNGRIVLCATTGGGRYRCDSSRARRSYRASVDHDVDTLRSYFDGPAPLYLVDAEGHGCFALSQFRSLPAPPFGTSARFCFDPQTGAPLSTRVDRDEGPDGTEAPRVRSDVRDEDLRPPRDGARSSTFDHSP